ncbi:MAG: hypothetical protein A2729_01405 [Candidatus Buchananbacteria bacterium RIFCSPHIGHO2_01_FULL_39_14]|uniref:HIT domain-containing protein n=2 Tax=Candidatus Buchananiibacteriota TaxID=1817903 RepID=A0A1G1YV13_9BACT|nr:MAG: hypothetical protein A2729_01405 [Candidatus Buchananbacteria bacterium RIFCSPHIGHO2_01_FULL_39_14]OGY49221.1 MAG: hypothetical protein A3D39_00430 [Candidatus Buchananbacteria bacterium RIFCSPHIGHO2_02_FULL_39_17]OGY55420.1 MAG: hypothetical protein A2912_00765 [Candidatus Buchananbacteria bacterium RIFCSPLOWO2_01_FULL_40_23b]
MSKVNCLICQRIKSIKKGKNPYFIRELKTGYVVLGDYQFFKGYTLFLCKLHKTEVHQLSPSFRRQFLWEMSLVAEAVDLTFKPNKINYELLGNTDKHLHWHIFPRYKDDPIPTKPVWLIDKKIREKKSSRPSKNKLLKLKKKINRKLENIIKKPLYKN